VAIASIGGVRSIPVTLPDGPAFADAIRATATETFADVHRRSLSGRGLAVHQAYTFSVYHWCMARVRTNIEIEDTYVRAIMQRFGVRSKTEAVELALRHLAGQPMTREEAMAMRGARAILEPPADVGLPEAG
jgi:Arc/MetJ family transcription regulator